MKWTTKATIQRILDAVPLGQKIYFAGQRYAGGFRRFSISRHLNDVKTLTAMFAMTDTPLAGSRAVEIGAGWMPVVPIALWMHGMMSCASYDVSPLLKDEFIPRIIERLPDADHFESPFLESHPSVREIWNRRRNELQTLVRDGASASTILKRCGINYHAPVDTGALALPDESVDIVFSVSVLEHVPTNEIHRIFSECRRILRPNGIMVHIINPSDHFSHGDPSIASINFLQYSEKDFARYNTSFCYQNRLRASQYRQMIIQHNFSVLAFRAPVDFTAMERLDQIPLNPYFAQFSKEDLCAHEVNVVAQRQ